MIPSNLKSARKIIAESDLTAFSFDIFDTFILRKTNGPDGVYERAFNYAPISENYNHMAESFVQNRMLAEQRARKKSIEKNGRGEISIEDIYQYFPTHAFGLTSQDRVNLIEAEFKAELDLCILNYEIYELLQEAKSLGLKVGFLSDTYWSETRLKELLYNVAPELQFDFLYASCEYGVGKANGLFIKYLKAESILPAQTLHIGDNPIADVQAPEVLGIRTVYYPQSSDALRSIFQREKGILQLIQSQRGNVSKRLDGSLSVVRRIATARLMDNTDTALIGIAVLGPVMTAFQNFIEWRVAALSGSDKNVAVLFLARDGYLPMKLWEKTQMGTAHYIEISRRIALIGCADDITVIQDFFSMVTVVNAEAAQAVFKTKLPSIEAFFHKRATKTISGSEFARELPKLLNKKEIHALSSNMRRDLIKYLRHHIPDLDEVTDVVLVDMGYSGTIQHALRKCFDKEGLEDKNIHGIYVATVDNKFSHLRPEDSVSGLIDSSIITPGAQHTLLRNIAIFEQLCSAPVGSVCGYDKEKVHREKDYRPPEQLALCADIQDACLDFFSQYNLITKQLKISPLADIQNGRLMATAILMRFLLMPSLEEQKIFGSLQHDVNLGTRTMMDMVDSPKIASLLNTMILPQTYAIGDNPAWLAGSLAAISPISCYTYTMSGFGFTEGEMLSDSPIGQVEVQLLKDGAGQTLAGNAMKTAFGDLRIRIPILQKYSDSVVAIGLGGILSKGIIYSLTLQEGSDVAEALHNHTLISISPMAVRYLHTERNGNHFQATAPDSYMLIDIPPSNQTLMVLTLLNSAAKI